MKSTTDKAEKECLQSTRDKIREFQKRGLCNLRHKKTKEPRWKENHGIQNIGTEDSIGKRQVLKIWDNYIRVIRSN
jgi:hypothetical protein